MKRHWLKHITRAVAFAAATALAASMPRPVDAADTTCNGDTGPECGQHEDCTNLIIFKFCTTTYFYRCHLPFGC